VANLLKSVNERAILADTALQINTGKIRGDNVPIDDADRREIECDSSHGIGYKTRQHLQIIGNKANYACLHRDTGTGLSVLLVP
jgi:hypothetical protein